MKWRCISRHLNSFKSHSYKSSSLNAFTESRALDICQKGQKSSKMTWDFAAAIHKFNIRYSLSTAQTFSCWELGIRFSPLWLSCYIQMQLENVHVMLRFTSNRKIGIIWMGSALNLDIRSISLRLAILERGNYLFPGSYKTVSMHLGEFLSGRFVLVIDTRCLSFTKTVKFSSWHGNSDLTWTEITFPFKLFRASSVLNLFLNKRCTNFR